MAKLFTRIDNPDPSWFLRSYMQEHYLPTEVVVSEPKIVVPQVGRSYEIDLYCRWEVDGQLVREGTGPKVYTTNQAGSFRDAVLIPYDTLRTLPDFEGTSKEIQVRLYEIWGDYGDDGHTRYRPVCWMLYPGECKTVPFHKMWDEYYENLRE